MMANASASDSFLPSNLDCYDYIRTGAMTAAILVSCFRDRKTFLSAYAIIGTVFGLAHMLSPALEIKHVSDIVPDAVSLFVMRFIGGMFIAFSFTLWTRWLKSRDELIISAVVWSQFIALALAVLVSWYYRAKFREEFTWFGMWTQVLLLIVMFTQVVRYVNPQGGIEKSGVLVWLLRADFFLSFSCAMTDFAFPDMVYSFQNIQPTAQHYYLLRSCGAVHIGVCLMTLAATYFRTEDDRKDIFKMKIISYGLAGLALLYGYFFEGLAPTCRELCFLSLAFYPVIPSVIGLIYLKKSKSGTTYKSSYSSRGVYYTRSSSNN